MDGIAFLPMFIWDGFGQVLRHLLAGFYYFLRTNLPAISTDAGTWGPGLVAFLLALAVGHRFLAPWAAARNLPWGVRSTIGLGLVLPVLFAIAFIVPGVFLCVELLWETVWFERR